MTLTNYHQILEEQMLNIKLEYRIHSTNYYFFFYNEVNENIFKNTLNIQILKIIFFNK